MAIHDRSTKSVDVGDVGEQLDDLLAHAAKTREPVIIERDGQTVGAIISRAELARFRHLISERKRDFAVVEEMRRAFDGVPSEEIEREAAKALAEVRAEMELERQAAAQAHE